MMVLIPLRGWAGDLMSVQMATGVLALQAASAMPIDCPMLTRADADPASPASSGKAVCKSCDLCIPMAALTRPPFEVVHVTTHVMPPMGDVSFRSAAATLCLRPPIS
jgi:hypothetical protein